MRLPIRLNLIFALSAAMVLSACASLAPVRAPNNNSEHAVFNMDARFAVQYSENNESKNLTGKMQWEETPKATEITLASPIGNAIANLYVTKIEATLKTANGDMYSEKTVEELLYRALGYELPLSRMRQIIGVPNRVLPDTMKVDGWDVKVLKRYGNPNLAKKLLISRTTPTAVDMTLFIDERSDAPAE